MEIITGIERRHQWPLERKLAVLEEAACSLESAASVARRHDIRPQQLYRWWRELREVRLDGTEPTPTFLPCRLQIGRSRSRPRGSRNAAAACTVRGLRSSSATAGCCGSMPDRGGRPATADRRAGDGMIGPSGNVRVYLTFGPTDMRNGFDGLAVAAQEQLRHDPCLGAIFAFRGKRGDRVKLLWWDGQDFCLFYKRLESGGAKFVHGSAGIVPLRAA